MDARRATVARPACLGAAPLKSQDEPSDVIWPLQGQHVPCMREKDKTRALNFPCENTRHVEASRTIVLARHDEQRHLEFAQARPRRWLQRRRPAGKRPHTSVVQDDRPKARCAAMSDTSQKRALPPQLGRAPRVSALDGFDDGLHPVEGRGRFDSRHARREQYEPIHAVRVRQREIDGHRRSHRDTDEGCSIDSETVKEREEVHARRRQRVGDGRSPVTPHVVADNTTRLRDDRCNVIPLSEVHLKPVNEHDHRTGTLRAIAQAAGGELTVHLRVSQSDKHQPEARRDCRALHDVTSG
jgi:hypothetical protein